MLLVTLKVAFSWAVVCSPHLVLVHSYDCHGSFHELTGDKSFQSHGELVCFCRILQLLGSRVCLHVAFGIQKTSLLDLDRSSGSERLSHQVE